MLAWRTVTRPAATSRLGSQLQRRFIFPSRSQLQVSPRLNSWLTKIRFRADGKPRSKLIALGFGEYPFYFISFFEQTDWYFSILSPEGSLILFNSSLLYKIINVIEGGEEVQQYVAGIICIQHMDITTYNSVNFDDPISTLSYYKKIYRCYSQDSEEEIDGTFEFLMEFFTTRGSKISAEVRMHHIIRSTAEKIHSAFQELSRDPYLITSKFVMELIAEADQRFISLIHDCIVAEPLLPTPSSWFAIIIRRMLELWGPWVKWKVRALTMFISLTDWTWSLEFYSRLESPYVVRETIRPTILSG